LTRLSAIGAGDLTCVGQQREAEQVTAAEDFLSTPYRYLHKLSAKFYTAVAAVSVHVKTSPEIARKLWRLKAPSGLGLEETETPA